MKKAEISKLFGVSEQKNQYVKRDLNIWSLTMKSDDMKTEVEHDG